MQIPYDVKLCGAAAIGHYQEMIAKGVSPKLAEAFACRQPPGLGTALSPGATVGMDSGFMQGRKNGEDLAAMSPRHRKRLLEQARKAGISISGKVYVGSLADHRLGGDPAAWVDSPSDIVKVAKRRGKNARGAGHDYTAPQAPPKPPKTVSKKAIREEMARTIAEDPSKVHNLRKLAKETEERLTPSWKKHLIKG